MQKNFEDQRGRREHRKKCTTKASPELKEFAKKSGERARIYVALAPAKALGVLFFKIGLTKNIRRRLDELRVFCPIPVVRLLHFEAFSARKAEKYLHEEFRKYRTAGEWFVMRYDSAEEIHDRLMRAMSSFCDDDEEIEATDTGFRIIEFGEGAELLSDRGKS